MNIECQKTRHARSWNFLTLNLVVLTNASHLYACLQAPPDVNPLTEFSLTRQSGSIVWTVLWWLFLGYIIVDTVWIYLYPGCVAAPIPILVHHGLLFLAWTIPIFFWEGYECYMSTTLLVEVNTFFLIAKRQATRDSFLHTLLTFLDHLSWMTIRVIGLPIMFFNAYHVWLHLTEQSTGRSSAPFLNSGAFVLLIGGILLYQNAMWTWDKYKFLVFSSNHPKAPAESNLKSKVR